MIQNLLALRMRFLLQIEDKESLLRLIDESEIAEQVYNSNAIENSTLSLEETEKVLMQIDLERFITERELFESKNLAKVVQYISKKAKTHPLNKEIILFLHKTLLSNIRDEIAWRFRQDDEWVKVWNHIAPSPEHVEKRIKKALLEYENNIEKNIIERIAHLHLEFENIHPFVDGNGRIWRVLNNYLLIRENFVPINIRFVERKTYYSALKEYDLKKTTKKMEDIIYKALMNSYHKRLAYLEWKEIMTLNEYAKQNWLSHSNLINKAHRQSIPAFIEKGIWRIGV